MEKAPLLSRTNSPLGPVSIEKASPSTRRLSAAGLPLRSSRRTSACIGY
jgi:hypothetical protein